MDHQRMKEVKTAIEIFGMMKARNEVFTVGCLLKLLNLREDFIFEKIIIY